MESPSTTKVIIVANKRIFMQHLTGNGHPESPKRVEAIEECLRKAKLMNDDNTLSPRQAKNNEIAHLSEGDTQSFDTQHYRFPHIPGDFQISEQTYQTAIYAAGAPITAIDYILDQKNNAIRAFCIVRPPGHHAHYQTGSGFCVFNNVAIAAKYLVTKGYKVAIVDWDAHHGDGTQELTENDKNIFYFSTHRDTARNGGFYPGPHWGHATQKGQFNQVMNCPVSGDQAACREGILSAYKLFQPAMDNFKPDFILISCGFDAHQNDTLVGLGLKDEDYKLMTEICIEIANKHSKGRIVSVLEGGYNLEAISGAAKIHVETLTKE
jgi:acetoin utilization deacetylase AcuC-like enzyme